MNHITKRILIIAALLLGILVVVTFGVYLFIRIQTHSFIYSTVDSAPHAQVALVLGAAILKNDSPSPVLKDRADSALALYKAGKVDKILVTGNNDSASYNEVNPVRTYLMKNGVPANAIFLDHAGFDTYSSMYRAKAIFQVQSIIVVTQGFHVPRAVFIARSMGLDAYGFDADNGHYLFKNYIRESFANIKAVIDLMYNRQPKYLGTTVPVSGNGNE